MTLKIISSRCGGVFATLERALSSVGVRLINRSPAPSDIPDGRVEGDDTYAFLPVYKSFPSHSTARLTPSIARATTEPPSWRRSLTMLSTNSPGISVFLTPLST